MIEYGDIITLENNKEYVVASTCTYKDLQYAYIVNLKDIKDCILGSIEKDEFKVIDNLDEFNLIMPLILDNIDMKIFEEEENNG